MRRVPGLIIAWGGAGVFWMMALLTLNGVLNGPDAPEGLMVCSAGAGMMTLLGLFVLLGDP